MVRRTRALASAAALALMAALAGPVSADSLQDAIALAYQTNPTLLAQRAQQRALDETYVQARSGLRPTIDASVGASYTRNYGSRRRRRHRRHPGADRHRWGRNPGRHGHDPRCGLHQRRGRAREQLGQRQRGPVPDPLHRWPHRPRHQRRRSQRDGRAPEPARGRAVGAARRDPGLCGRATRHGGAAHPPGQPAGSAPSIGRGQRPVRGGRDHPHRRGPGRGAPGPVRIGSGHRPRRSCP